VADSRTVDLDVPVPSCPSWRLRDLLAHIGYVHRWAATYVAEGVVEEMASLDEDAILGSAPTGDSLRGWVEDGHGTLVEVLSKAPADMQCWTFLEAPSPLAMWARRQAHETTVHRVDAELAAQRPVTGVDPVFAVDGIDELVMGFLGRGGPGPSDETTLGTMGLAPTDRPERWTVRIRPETLDATAELVRPDVVVGASASDLYFWLWKRPAPVHWEPAGGVEVLERWAHRVQLTWG
jgi:uncharacterized protein (TIGR03083 family)